MDHKNRPPGPVAPVGSSINPLAGRFQLIEAYCQGVLYKV